MTLILPQLNHDTGQVPDRVKKRLEELYSLELLDTSSDERLKRYTELATNVLDLPFASAFVQSNEQLVVSAFSGDIARNVEGESSIAIRAMAEDGLFVVEDARSDSRLRSHALVLGDPYIRFCAGVPIRGPAEEVLGALSVMDTVARSFSSREQQILLQIGRLLEHEFESRARVAELRQRLRDQVLLDSSTQLPTEALFTARLARILERSPTAPVMLVLVRLERFESVFSAVGKPGAAFLIKGAAARLRGAIRRKCLIGKTREDTIALAFRPAESGRPEVEIQRILDCFEYPFLLGDHTLSQAVTIGAAIHPADGQDSDTLLKRARTALHAVPHSDASRFRRYHRSLSHEAARRFEIETALRGAIDRDELELVYQPKVEIATGNVVGAEALLRWTNPILGHVGPDEFIPIAEDSGLIIQVGNWALAAACAQIAEWLAWGYECPQISVNVSGVQLRYQRFTGQVRSLLETHAVDGSKLNLEVTEGTLIENIEDAIAIMVELRELGIDFSIDDFGKGFSSLSYLARMPVQTLKIDRAFVESIPKDPAGMTLIRSMVAMSHGLGLRTVAEGVETREQLDALRDAGCDEIQGYLINRPLSPRAFTLEHLQPGQQSENSKHRGYL